MIAWIASVCKLFYAPRGVSVTSTAAALWLPIMLALAGAGAAAALAYKLGRAPLQAEIAQMKLNRIESAQAVADAQALRVAQAQAKSDALALALGQTIVRNLSLTSEMSHALQTATDGRVCLRGRALGLLNQAPGIRVATPMPAPERSALTAGAEPAADSLAAASTTNASPTVVITDTALAVWAAQAGGLYETCRLRLDALIDWHTAESPHTHTHTTALTP